MFFYEVLVDLNIIEAIEKTLVDVDHYSNYNTYLKSLRENDNLEAEESNIDNEENNKKARLKIGSIECLINILSVVPRI
jgi:hypothetical protein